MKTIIIEKYPDWCLDEVDKLIHEIIVAPENSEMTFTQLKNAIYSKVFEALAKESLIERLVKLEKNGILEHTSKETTIEVWRKKQSNTDKNQPELNKSTKENKE